MKVLKSKAFVSAAAVSGMLFATTAAAATPAPQTRANPWAVLSVMTGGAQAVATCGSAAAAAGAAATAGQPTGGCVLPQLDAVPVAPQQPAPVYVAPVASTGALGISPLFLGLAALAAGVGLFFAVRNGHPNSPA